MVPFLIGEAGGSRALCQVVVFAFLFFLFDVLFLIGRQLMLGVEMMVFFVVKLHGCNLPLCLHAKLQ